MHRFPLKTQHSFISTRKIFSSCSALTSNSTFTGHFPISIVTAPDDESLAGSSHTAHPCGIIASLFVSFTDGKSSSHAASRNFRCQSANEKSSINLQIFLAKHKISKRPDRTHNKAGRADGVICATQQKCASIVS